VYSIILTGSTPTSAALRCSLRDQLGELYVCGSSLARALRIDSEAATSPARAYRELQQPRQSNLSAMLRHGVQRGSVPTFVVRMGRRLPGRQRLCDECHGTGRVRPLGCETLITRMREKSSA